MSDFTGFDRPAANYSKLPHAFIEQLPNIDSMAELKVVLYLLRHTWGFSEYGKPKRITTDEFMNGRKRKDGSRLDNGTGLSNNSVITGLEKAIEHGFVLVEVDDIDKARIEKCYCLNMSDVQDLHTDPQELHSQPQELHSGYEESAQRSEKETLETNLIKNKDICLEILQDYAVSIFPEYMTWQRLKVRLQSEYISITGNKEQITIKGLSEPYGQFTEAQVWEQKYGPSFASRGLQITFQE